MNVLLAGKTMDDLAADVFLRAAFERFIEIISEASRHIPADLKAAEPSVPWRNVADIGNHLRHGYHRVSAEALWLTYDQGELRALDEAVARILHRVGGA